MAAMSVAYLIGNNDDEESQHIVSNEAVCSQIIDAMMITLFGNEDKEEGAFDKFFFRGAPWTVQGVCVCVSCVFWVYTCVHE